MLVALAILALVSSAFAFGLPPRSSGSSACDVSKLAMAADHAHLKAMGSGTVVVLPTPLDGSQRQLLAARFDWINQSVRVGKGTLARLVALRAGRADFIAVAESDEGNGCS
jgi:hypothetical protein